MQENNQTTDTPNTTPDTQATPVVPTETQSSTPVDTTVAMNNETANTAAAPVMAQPEPETMPASMPTATTPVATSDTPSTDMPTAVATPAPLLAMTPSKKQVLTQYGIATLVVLIMAGGLAYALEQQGRINTGVFTKISAFVNPEPAAAFVNGKRITKAEYEKNLGQLQTAATAQGADVSSESIQTEIKKRAIDVLVNTELLRQEAAKDGAVVTTEEVEARYQEISKSLGGDEQLKTKMAELGITEPALRKDIEGEILIQGHLSKSVDTSKISVTEEDVTNAYAQIKSTAGAGVTVPPLAEIKTQLEAQLKTNKEQELVNAYITSLRDTAEIEVLI